MKTYTAAARLSARLRTAIFVVGLPAVEKEIILNATH